MSHFIGGPLDGLDTDDTDTGLCIDLDDGTYACYYRVPWDECVFRYDGDYHFHRVVTKDELEAAP